MRTKPFSPSNSWYRAMMGKTAGIKWNGALGIIHEVSRRKHFISSPSRNCCVQCCAFLHMEKVPSNKNRHTCKDFNVKQLKHISLSPWTHSQQWTQISVKGSRAEQHCLSGRGNRVLNKRKNAVQERLFQFHCPPPPNLSWYEVRTACDAKTGYTRQQNVSY